MLQNLLSLRQFQLTKYSFSIHNYTHVHPRLDSPDCLPRSPTHSLVVNECSQQTIYTYSVAYLCGMKMLIIAPPSKSLVFTSRFINTRIESCVVRSIYFVETIKDTGKKK